MALTKEQLAKLPPSVAALLASQAVGDQGLPAQTDPSASVMSGLQGALGRRFGEKGEFDAGYDAELRGIMGEVPGLQAGFDKSRQRQGEDFTLSAEGLDKQNVKNRDTHLSRMANQGLGYSGANLLGQEQIGEQFQQGVQGLGRSYARGLDDTAASEADAYKRIQSRQTTSQTAAAERARVRDETRKWQETQERMATEAAAREAAEADRQAQEAQAEQQRFQQQLAALEGQALSDSQPMPTANGSYSSGTSGGGGGANTGGFDSNTNVSVDFKEYNLRDPNEVKALQTQLGLRPDGIIGPATITALKTKNAAFFDDRPINMETRNYQGAGAQR